MPVLNVLLVEDNEDDRVQIARELRPLFAEFDLEARIDERETFESALEAINDPANRYDLVISDTYRGEHRERDAAVNEIIRQYRAGRFCPLIVMSSGECPPDFKGSGFCIWADKAQPDSVDNAVRDTLGLGIPQIAHALHSELDKSTGNFLWGFLEEHWEALVQSTELTPGLLEKIIRRRAALMLSDLAPEQYAALGTRFGLEYYIYPALDNGHFSLGDVVRRTGSSPPEFRVILTPHCHLYVHDEGQKPKADFVLTIKTVPAGDVIGSEKLRNAKDADTPKRDKRLMQWSRSPAQTERKPDGRHWYLPKFLAIPHLYCDFLQIESLGYETLEQEFERIATLLPPYAEALQECFASFYGSVGVPDIDPKAIVDLLD